MLAQLRLLFPRNLVKLIPHATGTSNEATRKICIYIGLSLSLVFALLASACSHQESISRGETFNAGPVFAKDMPVLSHTFEIVNRSKRVLNILDEYHSCDCTKAEFGTRKIEPGGKTTIVMRVNIPNAYGQQSVVSNIRTDHPNTPSLRYTLNYTSYPNARVVPGTIDFGTIAPELENAEAATSNEPKRHTRPFLQQQAWVEVYSSPSQVRPLMMRSVVSPEDLVVNMEPSPRREQMPDGVLRFRYPLTLTLKPQPRPAQTYTRQLTIPFDDESTVSAQVVWKQVGTLVCVPSALAFGMAEPGDDSKRTGRVKIISQSGRAFRVIGVESETSSLVVTMRDSLMPFPTNASQSHDLLFTLSPPVRPGRVLSGLAVVKTDDPRSPEIRLPWTMFFRVSQQAAVRKED